MLLPLGVLLFQERPSLVNVLGVVVCIFGILMVNWRR